MECKVHKYIWEIWVHKGASNERKGWLNDMLQNMAKQNDKNKQGIRDLSNPAGQVKRIMSNHQKRDYAQNIQSEEKEVIAAKIKLNGRRWVVIEANLKEEKQQDLMSKVDAFIKRVQTKYTNWWIILSGDLNWGKNQQITKDKIERAIKLKCYNNNKTLVARGQKLKGRNEQSTINFILTNNEIAEWYRLIERAGSTASLLLEHKGASNQN